jgi:metallophosphoesterase (TIGR03767 family)
LTGGTTLAFASAALGGTSALGLEALSDLTQRRAVRIAGTTLESVATPTGSGPYRRLTAGPGWPLVVRSDLASGSSGRDDRRVPLASLVQLTDLHIVDVQSPLRFEYLHQFERSAHRPQEALGVAGAVSLVRRVNSLPGGPFSGRAFDAVVSTGDTTDNHESVELDWYLTVLSGGQLTPDTGAIGVFEGVQNSGSPLYWNPDSPVLDSYKKRGFPHAPGLLAAATAPLRSPGLATPWYSTFGNHDDSVCGAIPSELPLLHDFYTGGRKIEGVDAASMRRLADDVRTGHLRLRDLLRAAHGMIRRVTPDARRRPFDRAGYVRAHLDPAHLGPGPRGHGFSDAAADGRDVFGAFPIAPGVLGINLDSTNPAGFVNGSLGATQLRWLERTLIAASSRYYDSAGRLVRRSGADQLVLVFSHHTSASMDNLVPDPARPLESRHTGDELLALLGRFPNVLAWVNGHSHRNQITAHHGPTADRGFWEINTASHIDYPQHARVIEVLDNGDGTVSLFTTLIEAQAPARADVGDLSPQGLAALYRELGFNDPAGDAALLGGPLDHNTELLLATPARVH